MYKIIRIKPINQHSHSLENRYSNFLEDLKKYISTGYYTKENHNREFELYCYNHNQLVCDIYLSKINSNEKNQHNKCNICNIKAIKKEKLLKFNENENYFKGISKIPFEQIDKLSDINTKKEELKLEIKKNFYNLRNIINNKIISKVSLTKEINNREKQLISQIDILFNSLFFDGENRKEYDTILFISNIITKGIINIWNDEKKLNSLIGICICFEKCIEEIKTI